MFILFSTACLYLVLELKIFVDIIITDCADFVDKCSFNKGRTLFVRFMRFLGPIANGPRARARLATSITVNYYKCE